jgi:hypothetical protein
MATKKTSSSKSKQRAPIKKVVAKPTATSKPAKKVAKAVSQTVQRDNAKAAAPEELDLAAIARRASLARLMRA